MMFSELRDKFIKFINKNEIKFIKKRAKRVGFIIVEKRPTSISDIVVQNYFKTNFNKNALISYVINPFIGPISNRHSNQQECYAIAEILHNLSYNVDIIDGTNTSFKPSKNYDIVIDNHNTIERLYAYFKPSCIKVLHITHAHLLYQNAAEYKCLLNLQRRRGISLKPIRHYLPSNSILYCDFATCLASQFTAETYSFAKKEIFYIPITTNFESTINLSKDFNKCKRNYLWFGNTGAVLKGLDIVLEAFALMPDFKLTVCFPLESEPEFVKAYHRELFELPNIKTLGWIDVSSLEFIDLLKEHAFVVYASASEGGGGSIITCIKGGLIPIVSYQTSIDIKNFGLLIEGCNVERIQKEIYNSSKINISQLIEMSRSAVEYASTTHTIKNFKLNYQLFLEDRIC